MRWLLLLGPLRVAASEARYPAPDFSGGHQLPGNWFPGGPAAWWPWLDVGFLAAALVLAGVLVHRTRRRVPLLLLGLTCLLWFGFVRKGCVCPIGGIQNVAQGVADSAITVPLTILLVVLLPLVAALFVGRVFCGGICPFGILQEWVILRPLRLPGWLNAALGLGPLLVLLAAVVMAATGAGYPICAYDPFVGFFRFDGPWLMLLFGAGLLALGTVVARPFCRFLCPYGVLLAWMSSVGRWRVRATPAHCINCRLCADACPSQVLRPPAALVEEDPLPAARRRVRLLLVLIPLALGLGGWAGYAFGDRLAVAHPQVQTARELRRVEDGLSGATDRAWAFRSGTVSRERLVETVADIRARHRRIGLVLGLLVGLLVALRLIRMSSVRHHTDWRPDAADCLACLRCAETCPVERCRRAGRPLPRKVEDDA